MYLHKGFVVFALTVLVGGSFLVFLNAGLDFRLIAVRTEPAQKVTHAALKVEKFKDKLTAQTTRCPTIQHSSPPQCGPQFHGMHPLSKEPPYSCRLKEIRRRCNERNINREFVRSDRLKYGVNLPLVMCELPKVASTTWQTLLLKLNGFKGEVTKELLRKYAYHKFPHKTFHKVEVKNKLIHSLSAADAQKMLRNHTTFMTTRHPFERLVSAYYEKFSDLSDYAWYRRNLGMAIARKQASDYLHGVSIYVATGALSKLQMSSHFTELSKAQQDEVIRYRHVLQTGQISFQQFIRQILTFKRGTTDQNMDVHWRPQVLLCQPCAIDYSFVMRFENLVDESNRLLEFVQRERNTNVTFPDKSRSHKQAARTFDAFKLLSEADVDGLRDLYADDFYVLGHDPYRYSGRKR